MQNSSPPQRDVPFSLRRRFLLGGTFLLLCVLTASVLRHSSLFSLFETSPSLPTVQPQSDDDDTDSDFVKVATLASEEATSGKFRSGGLGLSRTAWEVLHGTPESTGPDLMVYQDKTYTYKILYQQDLVWQIEKAWGVTAPVPQQARASIRRYLPLDSHLTETVTTSADTIVDVYSSHMLAQLLSPQPPDPPTKKGKRRAKDLPTETCVVVHRLDKQKVTSSLLHIGAPKPEGYPPPQSQIAPPPISTTSTPGKNPAHNEARKEPLPSGKSKAQGKS